MQYALIVAILMFVVYVLSEPLRREPAGATPAPSVTPRELRLAELEAVREAKYREIRDADLDHRTGKLSDEDYAELDASLRAEAVEILNAFDHVESTDVDSIGSSPRGRTPGRGDADG